MADRCEAVNERGQRCGNDAGHPRCPTCLSSHPGVSPGPCDDAFHVTASSPLAAAPTHAIVEGMWRCEHGHYNLASPDVCAYCDVPREPKEGDRCANCSQPYENHGHHDGEGATCPDRSGQGFEFAAPAAAPDGEGEPTPLDEIIQVLRDMQRSQALGSLRPETFTTHALSVLDSAPDVLTALRSRLASGRSRSSSPSDTGADVMAVCPDCRNPWRVVSVAPLVVECSYPGCAMRLTASLAAGGREQEEQRARCDARRALYEATERAFVDGVLPPEFGPILRAYRETHHA